MIWNLHLKTLLAIAMGLALAGPAAAQEACPPATGRLIALAWPAYRADSIQQADRWFAAAYTLCRNSIEAQIGRCSASGCATVVAGDLVKIKTRCLKGADHICGNEETFYPPLTNVDDAMPAFTVEGSYTGDTLGVTFNDAGRRGAFLAKFSR